MSYGNESVTALASLRLLDRLVAKAVEEAEADAERLSGYLAEVLRWYENAMSSEFDFPHSAWWEREGEEQTRLAYHALRAHEARKASK